MADQGERVCPRCGAAADHNAYCAECGLDLSDQPELPTRSQWIEERQQPAEGATPPQAAAAPGGEPPPSPPPAKSEGRSFRRPVPLLIIGAALVGVVVAVIVIASSGGGGGNSTETVENRLQVLLAEQPYGVSKPNVECPTDIEFETGKTVECEASAADGTSANVEAEVESTSGEGEFKIENLIQTDSIANECSQELAEFTQSLGIGGGSCEVECPELAEAMPNGKLSCGFSLADGRGGTVEISLGPDGTTASGSWDATEE